MSTVRRQPYMPPLWVSLWLGLSSIIVTWDASYCFFRPRSMSGPMSWIWEPYKLYATIDYIYGQPAIDAGDGFTNAQSFMNVIEIILNIEYLYLRHFSSRMSKASPGIRTYNYHAHAPLVGFAVALMTLAKTALYFIQEYYCGWCMVGHNDTRTLITLWIIPNGVWIVIPAIICIVLGRDIAAALNRDFANEVAYIEWAELKEKGSTIPAEESVISISNGKTLKEAKSKPSIDTKSTPSQSLSVPIGGAPLPITFHPRGLPVLVIGHNRLAASRAFTLLEADADVIILSDVALSDTHGDIQNRVKHSLVRYERLAPGDLHQWAVYLSKRDIALVCVTDTLIGSAQRSMDSAADIMKACQSLHIPVNISDHPLLSTFTFPSVHRFAGVDGPSNLQIAVSTNGQGCRLSSRIRREIISRLPGTIGAAVDNVGRLREKAKSKSRKARIISEEDIDTPLNLPVPQLDTPSLLHRTNSELFKLNMSDEDQQLRRMRWVHQMSEYYSFDHLAKLSEEDMAIALDTWSESGSAVSLPHHSGLKSQTAQKKGRIALVGSGPGHPSLLTVAALQALRSATLILSDKLVPSEIIDLIPSTTKLHIAKKFPGNNEGAQNEMMELALAGAREGENVVRLKQGDPFVYGRGGEEVLYFRENGFESTLIPGISSALAGPLMMGIPVTQRGVSESFTLCTGVGRQGKKVQLPGYIKSRTLVVLMGVARIEQVISVLTSPEEEGRDGDVYPDYLPIAIIERASSPDQRIILSTLGGIVKALESIEQRPPGMMIIGWSALCLEGEGRVDILDLEGEKKERQVVKTWLGKEEWKIREGLSEEWSEYLKAI